MSWFSTTPKWKDVRNNKITNKNLTCKRCQNSVEYKFMQGSMGSSSKFYAFKCPICPEFELLDDSVAKAIMKRSGM